MEILIVCLLGCITAFIADRKGYNAVLWWLFGALLFIAAFPIILLRKPLAGSKDAGVPMKICPFCAEPIRKAAQVCKHCKKDQPAQPVRGK
jgi:hypothetical protein